jgi:hypothetical protein
MTCHISLTNLQNSQYVFSKHLRFYFSYILDVGDNIKQDMTNVTNGWAPNTNIHDLLIFKCECLEQYFPYGIL